MTRAGVLEYTLRRAVHRVNVITRRSCPTAPRSRAFPQRWSRAISAIDVLRPPVPYPCAPASSAARERTIDDLMDGTGTALTAGNVRVRRRKRTMAAGIQLL